MLSDLLTSAWSPAPSPVSVWWWCKLCRKNFSTSDTLRGHKMEVHPELFEGQKIEEQDQKQNCQSPKTCERVSVIVLSGSWKESRSIRANEKIPEPAQPPVMAESGPKFQSTLSILRQTLTMPPPAQENSENSKNINAPPSKIQANYSLPFKKNDKVRSRTRRPRRISFRDVGTSSRKQKRRDQQRPVGHRRIQNGAHHLATNKFVVAQSFGGIKLYACRLCMKLFPHLNRAYHHLQKHHPQPKLTKCQQSGWLRRRRRLQIQFSSHSKKFHAQENLVSEKKQKIEIQSIITNQEINMTPITTDLVSNVVPTMAGLDMTPPQSPKLDISNNDDEDQDMDCWTIDQEKAESILATCLFLTPPTSPPPPSLLVGGGSCDEKFFSDHPNSLETEKGDEQVMKEEDGTADQFSVSSIPRYCLCDQFSYGKMVACDNRKCPMKWFHFSCVGLKRSPRGRWKCPKCKSEGAKD